MFLFKIRITRVAHESDHDFLELAEDYSLNYFQVMVPEIFTSDKWLLLPTQTPPAQLYDSVENNIGRAIHHCGVINSYGSIPTRCLHCYNYLFKGRNDSVLIKKCFNL